MKKFRNGKNIYPSALNKEYDCKFLLYNLTILGGYLNEKNNNHNPTSITINSYI